jgi:two-component sensor histidine kinase
LDAAVPQQLIEQVLKYQTSASAAMSSEGAVLGLTPSFAALLGVPPSAAAGEPFERFLTSHDAVRFRQHLKSTGQEMAVLDVTLGTEQTSEFPAVRLWLRWIKIPEAILLVVAVPVRDVRIVEQFRDEANALEVVVAERTGALERALAEKEAALIENQALLREVHHRVKNNLQMLCDLLYLQMETAPDRDHRDLQDAYSRIYAIARLHEQLYRSMQSGHVLLRDYLGQLVSGFASIYPQAGIRLDVPSDPVYLDVDRAIHAGLIVNELITNAAKHAFPHGEAGEVVVSFRTSGDHLTLQVRDSGKGVPDDFDVAQTRTLGLRIVHILANRLHATVTVENRDGACFTIAFRLRTPPDPRPE